MLQYTSGHEAYDLEPLTERSELVCWTKMQAEAGQDLATIIARKERERLAGNGLFMWGVGNAPSSMISSLARLGRDVPVVFSLMKSKPKAVDLTPYNTLVWRRYIDHSGGERDLPANVLVTSRGDHAGLKKRHYALMCFSETPLEFQRGQGFDHRAFRNASGTGAPVGASQVTSLLRRVDKMSEQADYDANLQARLVGSYWVKVTDPAMLDAERIGLMASPFNGDADDWLALVAEIRGKPTTPGGAGHKGLLI